MNILAPSEQVIDRKPEKIFNINEADGCVLWDDNGKSHFLSDIRSGWTVVIIFLRHFLDYVTKEYVEDFKKISQEALLEANIQVIFVGCAPSKYIRQFKNETQCKFNLLCDPKRKLYQILNLHKYPVQNAKSGSPHVKSGYLVGWCKTMYNFFKSQEFQGDVFQQGGQAIIDKSGEIVYFYREKHSLDHTPLNDLLKLINLPLVDLNTMYKIKNI